MLASRTSVNCTSRSFLQFGLCLMWRAPSRVSRCASGFCLMYVGETNRRTSTRTGAPPRISIMLPSNLLLRAWLHLWIRERGRCQETIVLNARWRCASSGMRQQATRACMQSVFVACVLSRPWECARWRRWRRSRFSFTLLPLTLLAVLLSLSVSLLLCTRARAHTHTHL